MSYVMEMEWAAADKEYMDITSDNIDNINDSTDYIKNINENTDYINSISDNTDYINNFGTNFAADNLGIRNTTPVHWRILQETNRKYESSITPDETPLTLGKRINQSETELKIQKQNRVRALIRYRLEQENIVRERVEQKNIITNRLERENKLEQQNIIKQRQGQDYCSADREEKENITDKLEQKNLSTNRLDQENISTNRLEQGKISKNWQEQEKEVPRYSSQITEFLDKERDMDLLGSEQLDNEENDDILLTTSSSEQIISENEKKSLSKSTEFSPPVAEEKQKCETVLVSDAQKTGTELEEEFYSLLDKLVTDLNTHRHTGSVVTEEENMMEREDALVYIMEKENGVKNLEEEITTLYSECSQDASTQTDRIKRSRKCQIM